MEWVIGLVIVVIIAGALFWRQSKYSKPTGGPRKGTKTR